MSRSILKMSWLVVALAGCQGLGGYSAQSVTRVPPIGTGTYQVPGSYYGSAGPASNAGANNAQSTTGSVVTAGAESTGSHMGLPSTSSTNLPTTNPVATAGYSSVSDADLSIPQVSPASGFTSSSTGSNLQWQR